MPRSRFSRRPHTHLDWNPQASVAPAVSAVTANIAAQERIDALLHERLDLHGQLFEAAQIQRKLSGPRTLRDGTMQFASEVFAAHYLSGDFVVLSPDGSRVLTALGDIAGKGFAAGMWFTRDKTPPPADTEHQIAQHENWCYETMGYAECYPTAQNTEPDRLINVDPQNRYPLTNHEYWDVVYSNKQ